MRFDAFRWLLLPALGLFAFDAVAQRGSSKNAPPELPRCAAPVGTVAIDEPAHPWWRDYQLGSPEALIKMMAQRSNCLRVVDRGRGMQMRSGERALADSGELQRGANVGRGQVSAADYVIVPDIVGSDANAGGANVGGAIGGIVGGRFGAALGGLRTKKMEAHTLLTLLDLRTTEQLYVAEGMAQKTDISFGGGGYRGGALAVGGGYADTEIGKVITAAYTRAFIDLVGYMQGMSGNAAATAPVQAYVVTAATDLKRTPSDASGSVRGFKPGDLVYPTGGKEGIWWEVEDENGNPGWVSSAAISPRGQ